MDGDWFTEGGATGTLKVEPAEGGWFVALPGEVGETQCIFGEELQLDESQGGQEIEVTVSNFRWGVGRSPNMVWVHSADEESKITSREPSTDAETETTQSEPLDEDPQSGPDAQNEEWDLIDFTGSGEYVDVEVQIDAIFYIKKGEPGIPDVKGELLDGSVRRPVSFIVNDGVSHPYLGEGERYRLEGVKDHYYTKKAEIQVVITEHTRFEKLS